MCTHTCATTARRWLGPTVPSARWKCSYSTAAVHCPNHGAADDKYDDEKSVTHAYLHEALDAILGGDTVPSIETAPVGCTIKWAA
jgi:hypothetical protein